MMPAAARRSALHFAIGGCAALLLACAGKSAIAASPAAAPEPAAVAVPPAADMPVLAPSDFPDKVQNESSAYWISKWRAFRADAPAAKGADVVFLGDSMTERWPADLLPAGVRIVNRGIGGDKIGGWKYYGLIDRLDVSVCDVQPRMVVMMVGVNDIVFAGTPRESMVANYDRLLGEMRACVPDARIVLLPVLPVRTTTKTFNPQIVAFNGAAREAAKKHGCEFVDLHPLFLDAAGELRAELASDPVHLNRDGYAVWAGAISRLFENR